MIFLFPTPLIKVDCNLDLAQLEHKCREHRATEPSGNKSNVGGYQGHYFNINNMSPHIQDEDLYTIIKRSLPSLKSQPITGFKYEAWVNMLGYNAYNERHHHDAHSGAFMSGVFYVKCPEGSGRIRFYDPRPHINTAPDMRYYNAGNTHHWFTPVPNTLLMFPAWLEHDVEINKSKEERISISFNVFDVEY